MNQTHPLYYLWEHKLPILGALMMITTAAIATMPPPGQPFNLYTWIYDWSHQVLNIKNTRLIGEPIPTPPADAGDAVVPKS